MIIRLHFGDGFVDVDKILNLDCPNVYHGIGNITVHCVDIALWTGEIHLIGKEFTFNFSCVTKIESRSDNNENSEEPWITIWERGNSPITSPLYFKAAQKLRSFNFGDLNA